MKLALLALAVFLTITVCMTYASAINAYIRPNYIELTLNYVQGQSTSVGSSIEIMNKDTYNVTVDITAEDGLENMTTFPQNHILLVPNQTKNANFTITVPGPGFYSGIIRPTYKKADGTGIPNGILYADVRVIATGASPSCNCNTNALESRVSNLESNVTSLWSLAGIIKNAVCMLFNAVGITNPFWPCGASNVTCYSNPGCGTSQFIENRYCAGSDIYQKYRTYTCQNPGTSQSYCTTIDTPALISHCTSGCSGGQCTDSIICSSNSQCGTDGYTSPNYCFNGDVYRNYTTFTCNNPGQAGSSCSSNTSKILQQDCGTLNCAAGSCTPQQSKVIFRTNAVGGSYDYGTWIAYDINKDGKLDARQGKDIVLKNKPCPACVLTDYFGKCMIIDGGVPLMKTGETGGNCQYREYSTTYFGAEKSTTPVEPYASNHQEVYGS